MPKKLTLEEFVRRATEVHSGKYTYENSEYINCSTKTAITCPKHGVFYMRPYCHLQGMGCPKCKFEKVNGNKRFTLEEWINKAKAVHGDKYDYSLVEYKNSCTKVKIVCPIHGVFSQVATSHLQGNGCPICARKVAGLHCRMTTDEFIKRSNVIHKEKYDYSNTVYVKSNLPVKIMCPEHGMFEQLPVSHLSGHGCVLCANNIRKTKEQFAEEAEKIHPDKYIYTEVEYKNSHTPVKIICKIHGEFYITPHSLLKGDTCQKCSETKGEKKVRIFLEENGIEYIEQYRINLPFSALGKNNIKVDFYLPNLNTIIEFNGKQHYVEIPYFHRSKTAFASQQYRDKRLKEYCKNNGIKLIEIPYTEEYNINNFIKEKLWQK